MSDINITADFKDVQRLKEILGELAPLYARTVARIDRDNQLLKKSLTSSADTIERALDKVVGAAAQRSLEQWGAAQRRRMSMMKESEKLALDQARAEERLKEELEKQALAMQKAKAETAFALGAQRAREEAAAIEQLNNAKTQQVAREEFLRSKYDQSYAAMRLYKTELNTLNEALDIGAIDVAMYQRQVDALKNSLQSGSGIFQQFNNHINQGRGYTNQLGVVVQQTGYQVGDFLVQVQSGTNWMVAFGQQATQLVGTLPLLSDSLGMSAGRLIAISTGLGIAIPLVTAIGAAWMRTSEANDSASESMKGYKSVLEEVISATERLRLENQLYVTGLETLTQVKTTEELNRLQTELNSLMVEYNYLASQASEYSLADAAEMGAIATITQELRVQIRELEEKIRLYEKELAEAKKIEQQQERIRRSQDFAVKSMEDFTRRTEEAKQRLNEAWQNARNIQRVIESLSGTSIDVTVNFKAAYSNFTGVASEWLNKTWGTMQSIAEGGSPVFSSPRPKSAPNDIDFGLPDSKGGGGGGGGGSTTTIENKMEEIYKYLELEEYQIEQEKIAHKQREDILKTALENKMITLQEYNDLEKAITEQHNQDLLEIEMRTKNARLTELSGMFGQLASIMQAGGSRTAKIAATFGAIEATINSYVAATDALRKATTIPGKIAAYASILATGLKGVAAIRQAGGIGGGSGGGGPSSSTVAAATESAGPQTVYIDSIQPEALFSGQTLINLFDAFYNENDKRGKVFVVARG